MDFARARKSGGDNFHDEVGRAMAANWAGARVVSTRSTPSNQSAQNNFKPFCLSTRCGLGQSALRSIGANHCWPVSSWPMRMATDNPASSATDSLKQAA
jgi:hypothetical protein